MKHSVSGLNLPAFSPPFLLCDDGFIFWPESLSRMEERTRKRGYGVKERRGYKKR